MLSLKIKVNNETRRVTLDQAEVKALRARVAALFPQLNNGAFKITFFDENNVLKAVTSNADLLLASKLGASAVLTITPVNAQANKIIGANLHMDLLRAVEKFDRELRHVQTREVTHTVVDVKDPKARPLGKVVSSEQKYFNNINQLLWNRIRRGPSALEDPQIRQRIVNKDYRLKHVIPNVRTTPVVGVTSAKIASPSILAEVTKFDKNTLKSVQTRVSQQPLVCQSLPSAVAKEIASFSQKKQLNHVKPRVSNKVSVYPNMTDVEKKLFSELVNFNRKSFKHVKTVVSREPVRQTVSEVNKEIHAKILTFDKKNLKKVQTRVSHEPVRQTISEVQKAVNSEIVKVDKKKLNKVQTRITRGLLEPEAPKSAPVPAAPVAPAAPKSNLSDSVSQFQQNLNRLAEIGFTDRKRAIIALVQSNNKLEEAVLNLLGAL